MTTEILIVLVLLCVVVLFLIWLTRHNDQLKKMHILRHRVNVLMELADSTSDMPMTYQQERSLYNAASAMRHAYIELRPGDLSTVVELEMRCEQLADIIQNIIDGVGEK